MLRALLPALAATLVGASNGEAETGYELWLRYRPPSNSALLVRYRTQVGYVVVRGSLPTLAAAREELERGLTGILGRTVSAEPTPSREGLVLVQSAGNDLPHDIGRALTRVGREGYVIRAATIGGHRGIVIAADSDIGALYGVFAFLRHLQTGGSLDGLTIASAPKIQLRMLDHWDNLNRRVERGYAGLSLWEWDSLPGRISPRYKDYARANASIGINGAALTNVNANAKVITAEYLPKVAAIAGALRPYGVRISLTPRFTPPREVVGLKTADPLDSAVREWGKRKIDEIYLAIPDFGGFVGKANSEGQPRPQDYRRTPVEWAKMIPDAPAPHGGVAVRRAV